MAASDPCTNPVVEKRRWRVPGSVGVRLAGLTLVAWGGLGVWAGLIDERVQGFERAADEPPAPVVLAAAREATLAGLVSSPACVRATCRPANGAWVRTPERREPRSGHAPTVDFSLMTITCGGGWPFWPSLGASSALLVLGIALVGGATAIQIARDSAW